MALLKFEGNLGVIVVFAGSNRVSDEVLFFLFGNEHKDTIIYVFKEYKADMITIDRIRLLQPDVIITCYWPYLLKKEMIDIPKYGCINFHPAMLPKHRGWYPAVWQVLEGNAGVTLHLIDEGADTGPIIAQKEILIEETDTGGSVYVKSQEAMIVLFKETWIKLHNEGIILQEQDHNKASYRSKKDANDCDEIDIDQMYNAGYLIDLFRAKTFGNKGYAYYIKDGKKYFVKIQITESNG